MVDKLYVHLFFEQNGSESGDQTVCPPLMFVEFCQLFVDTQFVHFETLTGGLYDLVDRLFDHQWTYRLGDIVT